MFGCGIKALCLGLCALLLLDGAAQASEEPPRAHTYAFDQPELLATQRTFGVGNAVTLLGEACIDDAKAADSYAHWGDVNQGLLAEMTERLATHYRIPESANDLQQRVATVMHLKTTLTLSNSALSEACASLPDTLARPSMDLALRYQATLREVRDPNYLKPPTPKKTDDREEQTRSE